MHIKDFFDSDFKAFSNLDNVRSIPSVIDGFKDAQRKAVYGMFRHGTKDIKVAQLAGSSALVTHYAHGENSMADTIVGLAQNFPGSNNINLFEPIGQFGSILSSESSAHRYIFTKPSNHLREFIRPDDDCILKHRYEDGDKAEPLNYYPILPLWIVNGSVGIGTGHSVKILPRDPAKVSNLIGKLVAGKTLHQKTIDVILKPCFNGWTGKINALGDNKYEIVGTLEKVNTTTIRVTELPVGYSVDKFKSILVDLMDKGKVKDFDNNSTEDGFDFEVKVPREVGTKSEDELVSLFKLITRVTENITLWNTKGELQKYDSVYDALKEFLDFRLDMYENRRLVHISNNEETLSFLDSKMRFIEIWNSFENAGKMKTSVIEKEMIDGGVLEAFLPKLFSMRIASLSLEQVSELKKEIRSVKDEIRGLEAVTPQDLYTKDLKGL